MSACFLMNAFGRIGRVVNPAVVALTACALLAIGGTRSFAQSQSEPAPRGRILHVIGVDGAGLRPLPSEVGKTYGSPDWSSDGEWIAYDVSMLGQGLESTRIEVIRANGEDRREIGYGAMPSWSPDGKQIVAHIYTPSAIVVMDVDGGGRETIMEHWGSPRWSPIGDRVIAASSNGGLSVFSLGTGIEHGFLRQFSVHQGLSIAPDGERICFADRQGALMLATLDAETKQATSRRLVDGGFFSHSSWSPDGKQIAFTWQPDPSKDHDQLFLLDVDNQGQPPRRVKGVDPANESADPDWSPDGKQIAFVTKERQPTE